MAVRVGTTSLPLLYLFIVFQLLDQILLSILVVTFLFSKSVKRHPVVVNVCLTWIISGFISSLLLYTGKHVGPEPPILLCISQASLLDGVIPMNAVAVLALIFQVNFSVRHPQSKGFGTRSYALIVMPYVTFFCFSTSAAFLAVQEPQSASRGRRFFYCSFPNHITNAFAIFSALVLLVALGYGIALSLFLRNNWKQLADKIDVPFLSRVAWFGLYIILSLILSVLSIFAPESPFPDLFLASVGPALFIFFGTQRDVWHAWLRRPNTTPPRPVVPDVEDPYDMYHDSKGLGLTVKEMEAANVYQLDSEDINGPSDAKGTGLKDMVEEGTENDLYAEDSDTLHLDPTAKNQTKGLRGATPEGDGSLVSSKRRPRPPPLVINTRGITVRPDARQRVIVAPSYRFARPGMI